MQWVILSGIITAPLAYIGVYLFRNWALQKQLLDIPNGRSSHVLPTPRGGGVIIVIMTLLGLGLVMALGGISTQMTFLPIVISGIMIAVVGWLDDLHTLSSAVRLVVHVSAAGISIIGVGYFQILPVTTEIMLPLSYGGLVFTVVWIVGVTNAYNFMDGIDGLAGSQAMIASFGWIIIGFISETMWLEILGFIIAAASLGFLGHNWPPARVFMGDVASGFLGYLFAVIPLIFYKEHSAVAFPTGLLLLWPFLFDTGFTLIRRFLNGDNILKPHRSHLYQRLVIAGWTHRNVTSFYILLGCFGLLLAVAYDTGMIHAAFAGIILFFLSFCLYLIVRQSEYKTKTVVDSLGRK